MFLGSYRYEGNPEELQAAYQQALDQIPTAQMQLQVCIADDNGITVYDTCPSRDVFLAFSSSTDMKELMTSVGLPMPTVTPIGEVFTAYSGGQRMV